MNKTEIMSALGERWDPRDFVVVVVLFVFHFIFIFSVFVFLISELDSNFYKIGDFT